MTDQNNMGHAEQAGPQNAVCLTVDAKGLPYAVFIAEQAAREPDADRYDIVILVPVGAVSAQDAAYLAERADRYRVVEVEYDFAETASVLELLPGMAPASLWRMDLHHALGDRYEKVLYLDWDMYLKPGLGAIFDLDLQGKPAGCVEDFFISVYQRRHNPRKAQKLFDYKTTIGFEPGEPYFNSGMLLIDMPKWKAQEIGHKAFQFLRDEGGTVGLPDQSALNVALKGNWTKLSPRWNFQRPMLAIDVEEVVQPVVYHFTGERKPWRGDRWDGPEPFAIEYDAFLSTTHWPNEARSRFTLKNRVRRTAKALEDMSQWFNMRVPLTPHAKGLWAKRQCALEHVRSGDFVDALPGA